MDPSKPNDPAVDQGRSIPRSRPGDGEVLEGEIIGKDEPLGRPATVPPPSPPPAPPAAKGLGLRKTLLLVVTCVAIFVCLGGGLTAYLLYDKATSPDRSSPSVALQQYLSARFNGRDDVRARVFQCASPNLASVDDAVRDVRDLEAKFDISVTMSTSGLAVTSEEDEAAIRLNINLAIPEEGGRKSIQVQDWRFGMVYSDDWRVCSAERLS